MCRRSAPAGSPAPLSRTWGRPRLPPLRHPTARLGGRHNVAHGESRGDRARWNNFISPVGATSWRRMEWEPYVATAVARDLLSFLSPTAGAVGHIIAPLTGLGNAQRSRRLIQQTRDNQYQVFHSQISGTISVRRNSCEKK